MSRGSASLQARSSEAKRRGQPHLSPLPRSRSDRQDSPHPPLARDPLWPSSDGYFALSAQSPLSKCLFQNRRIVRFVERKEVTTKESIPHLRNSRSLRCASALHLESLGIGGVLSRQARPQCSTRPDRSRQIKSQGWQRGARPSLRRDQRSYRGHFGETARGKRLGPRADFHLHRWRNGCHGDS
jgi:hypothetical protein